MFILNKLRNPILWTKTSQSIYKVILKYINKKDKIIEIGSGTGHISYLLAKDGYNITLNEIRKDTLLQSKSVFEAKNVKCKYINRDVFKIYNNYDFAWSSGLIQCFNDNNKEKLVKKLSKISNKVLLFYPDTKNMGKHLGKNTNQIPGVDDAKEYPVSSVPEIIYKYFDIVELGELSKTEIGLNYKMFWVYGEILK